MSRRLSGIVALSLSSSILVACSITGIDGDADELGPFLTRVRSEVGDAREKVSEKSFLRQQEFLANCVAEAGFQYFPPDEDVLLIDMPTVEDVEVNLREDGWGVFTRSLSERGADHSSATEPSHQDLYVESLTEAAAAEYERVLTGLDPITGDAIEGEQGCEERAALAVADEDPRYAYADLLAEIRSAQEAATADPIFLDELAKYRSCMAAEGYPGIQYDARELVVKRFEEEVHDIGVDSENADIDDLAAWEIMVANTHLECLDAVQLDEAHAQATARIETDIMTRRAEEVAGYIEMLREQADGA